jgi:hypothetical protein
MVPEVQGGMLALPFMDHRMTSELGLMRTNCRTHAPPRDTVHSGHTLWRKLQVPRAPKRTRLHGTPRTLDTLCGVVPGARGSHGTPHTLDTLCGGVAGAGGSQVYNGVKHCSSGNGLRQMIQGCVVLQDTAHAGHTLRSISDSAGRWLQRPGAPKRTLSA